MESKVKLLGHPIHPMVIVFPLGLWITAVVFDVIWLATGRLDFVAASFWMIAAGLVGALVAALFGWIDWFAIPSDTRAKAIGLWHGAGNMIVAVLFAISWLVRLNAPGYDPGILGFVLSLLGIGIGAVTGWLGGEMVDRLGVGVDRGAHLNAPNSLSGRPASESVMSDDTTAGMEAMGTTSPRSTTRAA
jgi:uncharacterized membrane protein